MRQKGRNAKACSILTKADLKLLQHKKKCAKISDHPTNKTASLLRFIDFIAYHGNMALHSVKIIFRSLIYITNRLLRAEIRYAHKPE